MDIKKRLLLLLLCFISIVPSIAQRDHIDISNYILCINSYAESSPWSNRMISTVTEYVQKDPQLALYAEHMNMLMIENDSTLAEFKLSISQKYKRHRPRLLILLGNPALLMRDEYRELWGRLLSLSVCGHWRLTRCCLQMSFYRTRKKIKLLLFLDQRNTMNPIVGSLSCLVGL